MDRIERGYLLMMASIRVIMRHKKLLVFSLLSGTCSLIVVILFLGPIFLGGSSEVANFDNTIGHARQFLDQMKQDPYLYYGYTFAAFFCLYFITVFFNVAMISCAIKIFNGERASLRQGFASAVSLIHYIVGWVLFTATVGMLLSMVQKRSNKAGEVFAGFAGIVWSVATYFVVPVMAVKRIGPFSAISESIEILKKTWGENLVAEVGFGIIFAVLRFFWIVILGVGLFFGGPAVGTFFVVGLLYLFFLELFRVSMEPVFLGAVYLYACDGVVIDGMDEGLLVESFRTQKA